MGWSEAFGAFRNAIRGAASEGGHPVGAPFPTRDARRTARVQGCARVTPVRLAPSPWRGAWVGCTTEFRGHPRSRPRLGGTPVRDESVAAGCHATGCGPVPDLSHPHNLEAH